MCSFLQNSMFLVISTLGEICLFEEISPRILVEMTVLMQFSGVSLLFLNIY